MQRRLLLALAAGTGWLAARPGIVRAAAPWPLIGDDDVRRDRASPHRALTRGMTDPAAPKIEVDQPNPEHAVAPPFSFRMHFVAHPDAAIDPKSFKVTYGWLGIDITQKVLEHSRLTPSGLMADDISAPSGEHRVDVTIGDTAGRTGTRTLRFMVK